MPLTLKKVVALVLCVVALATVSPAAAGVDPRVPALQRQVAALQKLVVAMEGKQRREEDRVTCYYGLYRDAFGGVFHTLSLVVQLLTGQSPPPDPVRFDDGGACQRLGIAR